MDPLKSRLFLPDGSPAPTLWLFIDRRPAIGQSPMRPGHRVLCAVLCAVFLLIGFYAAIYLNGALLNQALDENAALRQENADLRAANGLPEPVFAPLARN